ncbi:MAG: hypothetical protein ACKOW3_09835 [Hyphomicrobium sp.]
MSFSRFWILSCLLTWLPATAEFAKADFDRPKTKLDCTKPENKDKPACKPKRGEATDEEIYHAAYWLAREGNYEKSLEILRMAQNSEDPRILNAKGFATRKMGDVDGALPYYLRALQLDPNLTLTRAYLGEAYLIKRNLHSAEEQLDEIVNRCGKTCEAYEHLSEKIALYKKEALTKG